MKFLNNIDLNGNQLLSPVIHVSSQSTITNGPAGDTSGTEGQIFYNSHANGKALFYRDNSAWRPIGDLLGVTAGAGLSGGGTSGTISLAIDISEFSDVTPANGDKLLTLDSDGSTEQLSTVAALATLFAGSGLTATNSVIAVDTLNQDTTGTASLVTVTDSTANTDFPVVFHNESNGLLDDTAAFEYNPSSGTLIVANLDVGTDVDIDGTMEADVVTIDGTNLLTGAVTFSGDTIFSGTPSISGTLSVAADIVHTGDTNNKITFTTDVQTFTTGGSSRMSIADNGVQMGGSGARVTTILDEDAMGSDSATALATQQSIKAYVDANTGGSVTSLGTITQDTVTFTSANANDPYVVIQNTTNDATGGHLKFNKSRNADAQDGDVLGSIEFWGYDDGTPSTQQYAEIQAKVVDASDEAEGGSLTFYIASHDGEMVKGIQIVDGNAEDEADITIGSGSSSITTIVGDLVVSGTTTTVNSTTVDVADININLGNGIGADSAVDGGGITLESTDSNKTFNWVNSTDSWTSNQGIDVTSGNVYRIAGTQVLGGTTLGSTIVSSSLTSVGTIGTGVWNGTAVTVAYGGTGATSLTDGGVLLGSGTGAVTAMSVLSDGEMIVGDGSGDPVAESGATLRTSIGVGTGDSPQLTAVNIGHASDTTLARSAAGKATIEGNLIGVVETFNLDNGDGHVAADQGSSDSTVFTITHGLGASRFYKVEVLKDSGDYDTVYTDVTRPSDTTIVITFGAAVANGAYRAMVTRMA